MGRRGRGPRLTLRTRRRLTGKVRSFDYNSNSAAAAFLEAIEIMHQVLQRIS